MGKVPFLDFQAIKKSYSIEEIMDLTGLSFKKDGKSYRCECPVHGGGKRSLAVTPSAKDDKGDDGAFFCHASELGGDRVSLLAHVRDSKPYTIFKELAEARPALPLASTVPEEKEEGSLKEASSFPKLPYIEPAHPSVTALGFPPEIAEALGWGYAPRGLHKQRIAVPLRLEDGRLIGYASLPPGCDIQLPPKWHL